MTSFEQLVYNMFLATSRSAQKKPFTLRKDWKDFEKSSNYIHVYRLANLFSRNPSIDPQRFFKAPYQVWSDEGYFDLTFYTTRKAIKAYNLVNEKTIG